MKIFYIENIRMPTEKAHGLQIAKMCEAFADQGHEVVLLVPKRTNHIKENPFHYYKIKENFTIKKVPILNILFLGRIGFWLQTALFGELCAWYIRLHKPNIIYSRDQIILINFYFVFKNFIWEAHRGEWNSVVKRVIKKALKVVVISEGLKHMYSEKLSSLGWTEYISKIHVAPDAVDISQFSVVTSKDECRIKLGLPLDKKIALYAGHLYNWKGVDVLAEASEFLDDGSLVVFVGGTDVDLMRFRKKFGNYKRCLILGQKPHEIIPLYLKSADVLILPNSGQFELSKLYTSPIKMFEYLASGVPIVASALPSIQEILNKDNAILVEPDNAESLSKGIIKAFNDKELTAIITRNMLTTAHMNTWKKRAERILNF